jgi:hypothetical protein
VDALFEIENIIEEPQNDQETLGKNISTVEVTHISAFGI